MSSAGGSGCASAGMATDIPTTASSRLQEFMTSAAASSLPQSISGWRQTVRASRTFAQPSWLIGNLPLRAPARSLRLGSADLSACARHQCGSSACARYCSNVRRSMARRAPVSCSCMHQDVDKASEWVAYIEAGHTPWLPCRSVFDRQARCDDTLMNIVEVVDLDREIRDRRAGTSFTRDADLGCCCDVPGCEGQDPAQVHYNL